MSLYNFFKYILSSSYKFTALIIGPFMLGLASDPLATFYLIERYTVLILALLSWHCTQSLSLDFLLIKDTTTQRATAQKLKLATLMLCALLSVAFLYLIKIKISETAFLLTFLLTGLSGLAQALNRRQKFNLGLFVSLIYYTGVGSLSFLASMYAFNWQFLVIALALASLICATKLAECFDTYGKQSCSQKFNLNFRAYKILMFSAPTMVALLSYSNLIHPNYSACIFLLLPASYLTSQEQAGQENAFKSIKLASASAGICILFTAIIGIIRLI